MTTQLQLEQKYGKMLAQSGETALSIFLKELAKDLQNFNILQKETRKIILSCNSGGITGVETMQRFK